MSAVPPRDAPAAYCGHCGDPLAESDHAGCVQRLELEPPRYCPDCGRRMKVQVVPAGWTATCVEHGTRHS